MAMTGYDDQLLWMVAVLLMLATGLAGALLAATRSSRPEPRRRR